MPLIDDHAAITHRMRELQAERFIRQLSEKSGQIDANITVTVHPTAAELSDWFEKRNRRLANDLIEAAREAKRQRQQQQPKTSAELRELIARLRAVAVEGFRLNPRSVKFTDAD